MSTATQNQKAHATTQKFTEVFDVVDNIVIFEGGFAALVLEVTASNFALQSKSEQDAKLYAYAALLNSLNFPIQILIRNKRVDISSYINSLAEEERKTKNDLLRQHIRSYTQFVEQMVQVNVVLNKTFYIILPFSSLESGITGVTQAVGKTSGTSTGFIHDAKKALLAKTDALMSQLQRLSLPAKVLEKEELVKLFYDIYNEGDFEVGEVTADTKSTFVKPAEAV